jgi:TetR/AcrR family transcriptional regulator, transcriptional repressor for nem operon
MRVSREAAQASKARITAEAARLMRENGIGGTSVADVMAAAGMTTGGFYKHFDSKEALAAAAVREAFNGILDGLAQNAQARGPEAARKAYFKRYLSPAHVAHPGKGCPVAALGPDGARGGPLIESEFQAGIERTMNLLGGDNLSPEERSAIIARMSALLGAVVLARAVGESPLREEILAAVRDLI